MEFRAFFPDEAACLDYLARLRWPGGFRCPARGEAGWRSARGRWACRGCGRQTSLTAGTIFEGTRKPLLDWLEVAWRITTAKNGVSALAVSSEWGMSREAGWTWLHKFRRAMVRPDRDLLTGEVEIDETFLGAAEDGVRGRQVRKAIVVVAVEKLPGDQIGRARLARVGDALSHLAPPVRDRQTWPPTRRSSPTSSRATSASTRSATCTSGSPSRGRGRRARTCCRASIWWRRGPAAGGSGHGAIRHRHLDAYLDEFMFRFNRRTSRARGLLFYRLLEGAVASDPAPFAAIRGGRP